MTSPDNNLTEQYPRCILGTCCVPWTRDHQFDEALFRRSVAHLLEHGTRHLYIFGTAGEGHAVSERQFQQITRAFAAEMASAGAAPMVGIISPSLGQVIDRIDWAQGIGVRQFQISLPSWGTCTSAEAFTFFERVCTRFPECVFLHYNLRRAGRLLAAEEYGRIAAAFGNLVAVKAAGATPDDAVAIHAAAPCLRLFLTEKTFGDACLRGVPAGFLISFASINWQIAQAYYAAALAGDAKAVAAHHAMQQPVIAAVRDAMGEMAHMDGAFDQMFIKRHLPEFPLRLLPPYAAASEAIFAQFIENLRRTEPRWLEQAKEQLP